MDASTAANVSTYDVIVVGAGSAGCIVAGRLAIETDARVLVIEDGGRDWSPLIKIPAGFSKLLEYHQFMYPYETVPQRWLGLSEQARAISKWSGCRFHAAARSGWLK
ncbi:GMC family oxidoreductase N-terminal domain-containing protein [Sphingosinicellaceae bacterium]|nr:GMC family oxidoreductase N-terminal domain-containing protein [Sphingosinicellaceae bacterium]